MAESGVILPADSTGKALRTLTETTTFTTGSGGVVHQQVVSVADPVTPAQLLLVDSSGRITANLGTLPSLTKGTQGATGVTTQDLKDAGRGLVVYYMVIPVLTTATDTLQSLTGTKGGATVTATTTPAVVTAGKTMRIQRMWVTYVATATSGYGIVRLRYNTGGVVAITSPALKTMAVGASAPTTANSTATEDAVVPDGTEVPAGTGLGISVQGFAAATATAVGYIMAGFSGYEY